MMMTEYKLNLWGFENPKKEIIKTSTGDVMVIYPETVQRAKEGDKYIESILLSIMETKYYVKLTKRIKQEYKADAIQTCHMSVLNALNTYKTDKGASFETYTIQKIKKALIDFVCATDAAVKMSPEALMASWEDITADDYVLESYINAPEIKVKKSPVSTTLQAQLQALYNCGDYDIEEEIAGKDAIANYDIKFSISYKGLTQRESEIIKKYYLEGKTTIELAKVYGISERRVRQIRTVARNKMRKNNIALRKEI